MAALSGDTAGRRRGGGRRRRCRARGRRARRRARRAGRRPTPITLPADVGGRALDDGTFAGQPSGLVAVGALAVERTRERVVDGERPPAPLAQRCAAARPAERHHRHPPGGAVAVASPSAQTSGGAGLAMSRCDADAVGGGGEECGVGAAALDRAHRAARRDCRALRAVAKRRRTAPAASPTESIALFARR